MRDTTIARNYAETLLVLATRAEDLRGWGKMLSDVATAMQENPTLRLFLESPRISAAQKSEVITKAFSDRMPRLMLRFFQTLVQHRRQMLIPTIAEEYYNLVDAAEGRIHARELARDRACSARTSCRTSPWIRRSWAVSSCTSATRCSTARCGSGSRRSAEEC